MQWQKSRHALFYSVQTHFSALSVRLCLDKAENTHSFEVLVLNVTLSDIRKESVLWFVLATVLTSRALCSFPKRVFLSDLLVSVDFLRF